MPAAEERREETAEIELVLAVCCLRAEERVELNVVVVKFVEEVSAIDDSAIAETNNDFDDAAIAKYNTYKLQRYYDY